MSDWTVILANGREFTSDDGGPDDVPRDPRVVAIAQVCGTETWKPVLVNGDWYVWRDDLGCWTEHTDQGMVLEMVDHAPVVGAVRAGKYVPKQVFHALWARAREIVADG